MKYSKAAYITLFCVLISLAGCDNKASSPAFFKKESSSSLKEIRGLGYLGEKKGLYAASSNGIHKYKDSTWFSPAKNKNNYISFQAAAGGFYASGYSEGNKKKPLGVVKSADEGRKLKVVPSTDKQTFPHLAAGLNNRILYMLSQKEGGILYTKDEGKTWTKSKLTGLTSNQLGGMAVHPDQGNSFALYAKEGIFLSSDFGDSFTLFPTTGPVTSMIFGKDSIIYSELLEDEPALFVLDLKTRRKSELSVPSRALNNPVLYLAVNPQNNKEIAAATYKNEIFVSKNSGQTWDKITTAKKKEK
ncbi:photosystem II stability/assembly factor-like uncharacterized protein [Peribacillus deserti]|uniref:Photosystem II stability/assembly factor-like uncharacterized protein n=1 Tax=Peribacillus deserti TaxID=673318 RepID=A0ABS2QKX9_9BACI|nr:hypothetical protein [Peribacillus deserti]MBM7693828.1 photosystem II stability/assembly factor-like uncharacterized protein [Peribacillus deserti]